MGHGQQLNLKWIWNTVIVWDNSRMQWTLHVHNCFQNHNIHVFTFLSSVNTAMAQVVEIHIKESLLMAWWHKKPELHQSSFGWTISCVTSAGFYHIEAWTKWPPCCRHFQMCFPDWNFLFPLKFYWNLFLWVHIFTIEEVSIDLNNEFVPVLLKIRSVTPLGTLLLLQKKRFVTSI